jgi:predicted kinase
MKSLQLDKPHAIVMVGIPGSGKSFFADKFSAMFNAPCIEQLALEHLAADSNAAKELANLFLDELVKTGRSIILETDTSTRQARTELNAKLKKAGYTPLLVWVQIDTETAANRSTKMGMSADEHAKRVKKFAPPLPNEQALVISGKHTYATQARVVLKKLSGPRTPSTHPPERPPQPPARGQIIVR